MVVFTVIFISAVVQLSVLTIGLKSTWQSGPNLANVIVTAAGVLLLLRGILTLLHTSIASPDQSGDPLGESIILATSLGLLIGIIRMVGRWSDPQIIMQSFGWFTRCRGITWFTKLSVSPRMDRF